MSVFDADEFMTQESTATMSISITPVSEGEFSGVIDSIKIKTPKEYVLMEVIWHLDDDATETDCGRRNVKVKQTLFLDVVDGSLDTSKGKNVGLGRLRAAVGQNEEGPWSPNMLEGQPALCNVVQDPDNDDPEIVYNRVTAVTSA